MDLGIAIAFAVSLAAAWLSTKLFTTMIRKAIAAAVVFILMLSTMGILSAVAGSLQLPSWALAKAEITAPPAAYPAPATQQPTVEAMVQCLDGSLASSREGCPPRPQRVDPGPTLTAPGGICQGVRMAPLPGEPHPLLVEGWAVIGVGGKVYVLSKGTYDYPATSEGDVTYFSQGCSKEQLSSEHAQPHAQRTGRAVVEGTGIFTKR